MAGIVQAYNNFLEYGDPRVKDWFLMSSPFPTMAISLTFVFIVKVNQEQKIATRILMRELFQILGPKLMEDRKPFNLRKIIIVYNLFQVILSWKIFYDAAQNAWITTGDHAYNWRCQNIDRSPTGIPMKVRKKSSESKEIVTFQFVQDLNQETV